MHIVFYEAQKYEQAYLRRALPKHRLTFVSGPLTPKTVSAARSGVEVGVFIWSTVQGVGAQTGARVKTNHRRFDWF